MAKINITNLSDKPITISDINNEIPGNKTLSFEKASVSKNIITLNDAVQQDKIKYDIEINSTELSSLSLNSFKFATSLDIKDVTIKVEMYDKGINDRLFLAINQSSLGCKFKLSEVIVNVHCGSRQGHNIYLTDSPDDDENHLLSFDAASIGYKDNNFMMLNQLDSFHKEYDSNLYLVKSNKSIYADVYIKIELIK